MAISDDKYNLVKVNLYEQIADRLEQIILSDQLQSKEKLPSEQVLAEKFDVSRSVVREALKLLKERGLIDSKNGNGSFITKPMPSNLSDVINRMYITENMDYNDIYDVRIILETAACKKAAKLISPASITSMERLLEQLKDKSISVQQRRELDFDFHVEIAKAADNSLLLILIEAMKNVFIEMIEKGIFVIGSIEDAAKRHESILIALKNQDAELAGRMMQEHLQVSKNNVQKFYEELYTEKQTASKKKHRSRL